MRAEQFIKSEHAAFPGLKSIEFHDGGTSIYGFARDFDHYDGHPTIRGYNTFDPSKDFAMTVGTYDSPMDFAEITKFAKDYSAPCNKDMISDAVAMRSAGRNWYGGFKTISDGYQMICDGWEDGARKAKIALGNIKIPDIDGIESMRRTLIFSDAGETLNIDQAMAGNWEKAWQTCKRIRSGVSRVLSIAIPFGGNCEKTADQLFWNGAQGMVITDILEDKGYRVQLYGVHLANQRIDGASTNDIDIIRLKNSDEPLRMDSIAAVVAHAGVFRTAGFMSIMAKPHKVAYGFGSCVEGQLPVALEAVAKLGLIHPDTMVLGGRYTMESAAENIIDFFKKMGGKQVDA